MKFIELLAPAKDYESAVVAVDSGADALYIGGARFGARQAAGNADEEIRRVVDYAHRYGVRVHSTLNTLLWDNELHDAEEQARKLIDAGVDALIVQDMALRRMNLPVELHASTQVSNMTEEGARFLGEVGFARVILERSLSLNEIRRICSATQAEVECFVHGAICVGYSGRCFLSRSISDRSGNRGACSQPCRLKWDLCDARGNKILKSKHLLSVRDMNLSHRIGDLLDAGVTSFKIEGRLKDTGYIRNVVAYYRQEIDKELKHRPDMCRSSVGETVLDFTPDPAKSFTRGFSEYFFDTKHAGVASFDTPKAVGEYLGMVSRIERGRRGAFRIDTAPALNTGDGICFITREGSFGTSVNGVDGAWIIPNRMDGIAEGMKVYRNSDHRFNLRLERSRTRRVIPAVASIAVSKDDISLKYKDIEGFEAEAGRTQHFAPAKNAERNADTLSTQAAKSGDTIFRVERVEVASAEWFVPASLLTELRREALDRLLEARTHRDFSHIILPENPAARYPWARVTADENVTNHLAKAFYRDHGVEEIEAPLELAPSMEGACVMRSAYCIRREIGECLRKNPTLKGDLYIEHGTSRYRLDFDCRRCEMRLIACKK